MTIFSANGSTNARQFEFRGEFYPQARHSLLRRGSFVQVALHQLDLLLLRDNDLHHQLLHSGVSISRSLHGRVPLPHAARSLRFPH
jgi:hypothetical protein